MSQTQIPWDKSVSSRAYYENWLHCVQIPVGLLPPVMFSVVFLACQTMEMFGRCGVGGGGGLCVVACCFLMHRFGFSILCQERIVLSPQKSSWAGSTLLELGGGDRLLLRMFPCGREGGERRMVPHSWLSTVYSPSSCQQRVAAFREACCHLACHRAGLPCWCPPSFPPSARLALAALIQQSTGQPSICAVLPTVIDNGHWLWT